MSDRYVQVNARGELAVMGENTMTPGPWLAALAKHAEGYPITAIVGDRFRHAEFIEALQKSGLSRVPYVSRGMGWKDGGEDVERFRRALFDGDVKTTTKGHVRQAGVISLMA